MSNTNKNKTTAKWLTLCVTAGYVLVLACSGLISASADMTESSKLLAVKAAETKELISQLTEEFSEESLDTARIRTLTAASAYANITEGKQADEEREQKAVEQAAAAVAGQGVTVATTTSYYSAGNGTFQASAYESVKSGKAKIPAYRAINSDVEGWLCIPGTNINYPILQDPNSDLSYYLHRNIYRSYDINGVIWTGPGTKFASSASGLNSNTVIYGHNWNNCYYPIRAAASWDTMFEQLAGYHYLSTAKSYPYFFFSTRDTDYTVVIFACFYARPSTFDYWHEATNSVINEARARSLHDFDVEVSSSDKIITLSTCTRMYGYGADQKFVVMGRVLRSGESIKEISVTANTDHRNP